jgi:putative transposase
MEIGIQRILDERLDGERVEGSANRRNGHSKRSVLTGTSKMTLSIPRDRAGTFDPKLIAKYQRRFPDFDENIISMYARGIARARSAVISRSSTVSTCRQT